MTHSSQARSSPIIRPSYVARHVAAAALGMVLLGSLGLGLGLSVASPAHAEEDDNLTVEIIDPTAPTPTPTPPVTPPAQGGGTPGPPITPPGRGGTTPPITPPAAAQLTIADPAAADAALGTQSESMAGLIYVSAAKTKPSLSFHPNGGPVNVVLSIRNVSGQAIDGLAKFWITTAWGWNMSEVLEVEVLALAPGETRELTATLPGPGQWVFYQTHAEFIPPASVDGVELTPIIRTENAIVFPLFSLGIAGIAGLGVAGYFWWARVFSRRGVLPA